MKPTKAVIEYQGIMWAELKADVYTGVKFDQHKPFWNVYAEGDKQEDNSEHDITLSLEQFPVGTKVTVESPICPECELFADECDCGFNWKEWAENKYG